MVTALVGFLIFVGCYVVVSYLLHAVKPLAGVAEILGVVAGILAALAYLGKL